MIGILFCAIFATSIAILLQTKYQHFVNPTKAALIYALEPVFAMLFAWTINQGDITSLMIIGGTVMLLSTLLRIFAKPQHETLKQS
jgi:drug/metabolite transporter (DMT)-like permease